MVFGLKKEIKELIKQYSELEDTGEEAEVKFAYVVFRSMEGKGRLCDLYHAPYFFSNWLKNNCFCCPCFKKGKGAT